MNVEHINPFLEAGINIIKSVLGKDTKLGQLKLLKAPYKSHQVLIIIGMTGDKISGQVAISIDQQTAERIASTMMGGQYANTFDSMARSALSELFNMIMGNAASILYNKGLYIDITPPTLLTGQDTELSFFSPAVSIPLHITDLGTMDMNVSIKEE